MLKPEVRMKASSYFAIIAACQWEGKELTSKIELFIRAALDNGAFHWTVGCAQTQEAIVIEFSADAIAGTQGEGAPPYELSPYFVQAMFMHHWSKGHIKPETTLLSVSPEARSAIERAMRRVGLDPVKDHKRMLDDDPL